LSWAYPERIAKGNSLNRKEIIKEGDVEGKRVTEKKIVSLLPLCFKKTCLVRGGWLTLVILATQEGEIRRIMVQSQPRQILPETPS
jgi:hypothetical protein